MEKKTCLTNSMTPAICTHNCQSPLKHWSWISSEEDFYLDSFFAYSSKVTDLGTW